jgi:hypothetical protein
MKTTKRTTKPKQSNADTTLVSQSFFESASEKDGSDCFVKKFLAIMEQITNQAHFSITDLYGFAKPFDLDVNRLKDLFTRWTDKETQLGNLERVEGCYSYPVFTVISNRSFKKSV